MKSTKWILLIIGLLALAVASNLLLAQFVVWRLSLYHVSSGIWEPFLLITAAESVVSTGTSSGLNRSKK